MAELFSSSAPPEELSLVNEIKKEMFFSTTSDDLYSIVSPSAYDTAWLAMIPDPHQHGRPMFPECLTWLLENQSQDGFWGHPFDHLVSLIPSVLACLVALKKWNVDSHYDAHISQGLEFVHENVEKLLVTNEQSCYRPSWFTLVFPAMVELALSEGLRLEFLGAFQGPVQQIFSARQRMLDMQELGSLLPYSPMALHLESLPASLIIDDLQEILAQHQSEDGSLFQSPSATARMFMATGDKTCLQYLKSIVNFCGIQGVPAIYPLDEELTKLCMINHLERLGLTEQFLEEIEVVLAKSYRKYLNQESRAKVQEVEPVQIYKDALAFRLLRRHGYHVSPWRFCWFLCQDDIKMHIEETFEYFVGAMFNVYRASDLMFLGEEELEEARSFSRKILEKATLLDAHETNVISPHFQRIIEHELKLPWLARLDHLEHRMSIEGGHEMNAPIWPNKGSFSRILFHYRIGALLQLSKEAFKLRQSIYKNELEKLERWSRDTGLSDMGFGREKTTYCYFAVATTISLPCHLEARLVAAKSGILITVADDFFDMEGSLEELYLLTEAVRRWDGKDLEGHGKVIFNALHDLVGDVAMKFFNEGRGNITKILQDLWYHTFKSWMTEAEWSRRSHNPSSKDYLETGMTSIAAHTVVIMTSCFMNPSIPFHTMRHITEQTITKLLMGSCRILNDIQSYQKEVDDGKVNLVLLYMKENRQASIDDSIAYLQKILERKKKDFLEHVLMDHTGNMPKSVREIHLGCLKVFQMFFNSGNAFDSKYELLDNINKAFYQPLEEAIKPQGLPSSTLLLPSLGIPKLNSLPQELSIKKAPFAPKSLINLEMFQSSLVPRAAHQPILFSVRTNVKILNVYPKFI